MNRAWFEEKIADKLLFGIIATCVTGLAFAQYESVGQNIAYAQKNVDTYVSYQKDNLDRIVRAIDATINNLYAEQAGSVQVIVLQVTASTSEAILRSTLPAFSGTGDIATTAGISGAISTCLATFSEKLQAHQIKDLENSDLIPPIIDELISCREGLIPAFSGYLAVLVDETFQSAVTAKSISIGPLRATWQTIFLTLLLVLAASIAALWYVRSPSTNPPPTKLP